ncbi:Calx-beta domain protein [uncultured archaeon]|nr:Calx-beta domain protein [uncultured archaeon]
MTDLGPPLQQKSATLDTTVFSPGQLPSVSIAPQTIELKEASPDETKALTITRWALDTSGALDVKLQVTSPQGARNGIDYGMVDQGGNIIPVPPTITIPAGQASATLNLKAIDDSIAEPDTTATITLDSSSEYSIVGAPQTAITIIDNDSAGVTVAAGPLTTISENGGTSTFTITRTGDASQPISVNYLIGGSAVQGTDYESAPPLGMLIYLPATAGASATIAVTAIDNTVQSPPTKDIILALQNGEGYSVGTPGSATVTIVDDEHYTCTDTTSQLCQGSCDAAMQEAGEGTCQIGQTCCAPKSAEHFTCVDTPDQLCQATACDGVTWESGPGTCSAGQFCCAPKATGQFTCEGIVGQKCKAAACDGIAWDSVPETCPTGQFCCAPKSIIPASPVAINLVKVEISADKAQYLKGSDDNVKLTIKAEKIGGTFTTAGITIMADSPTGQSTKLPAETANFSPGQGNTWETTVDYPAGGIGTLENGIYKFTAITALQAGETFSSDNSSSVVIIVSETNEAVPEIPPIMALLAAIAIIALARKNN